MLEILRNSNVFPTNEQVALMNAFIDALREKGVIVVNGDAETLMRLNSKRDRDYRIIGEWGAFYLVKCPFHKFDLNAICFQNALAINKYTRACWCLWEKREYDIIEVIKKFLNEKEIEKMLRRCK